MSKQLEKVCLYIGVVRERLDTRICVKYLLPEQALSSQSMKRARKLVQLNHLMGHTNQNIADVRIVRAFRVWQKDTTLDFYLDKMQIKMRRMKRGTVETRFKFIAKQVSGKLRRAFARWLLNSRALA